MTTECLVFTICNQRVCMPISAVQGIQPLHCTVPVPCTERWVLGLGLTDNRVFTVVCPVPHQEASKVPNLEDKMLLSRSCGAGFQAAQAGSAHRKAADLNWALRINQVLGMASITVDTDKHHFDQVWACPGDWFRPAKTRSGEDIAWLDPEAVNSALARVGGSV